MIPFLLPLSPHAYFVSPTGDDAADGLSRGRAFRTLGRVSKAPLGPGDAIVLSGTLEGSLRIDAGGTPGQPVVVRSDGKPATILSTGAPAITVRAGGVEIRDLILKGGATEARKDHDGILLAAPKGRRSPHVRIDRVDVSGFGSAGVSMTAEKDSLDGFDDVRLSRINVHGVYGTGIITSDGVAFLSKGYAHRGLRITDCEVSDNLDGTGMVISGVDGALVEFCRARDNRGSGGGLGMWAWCARRVTFRHCIASGTRSVGDGGGYDLDGGTVECAVERCLSFDNDGPGAMHCDYPSAPRTHDNSIRNCVSVNDGRKAKGDPIGFGYVVWGSGLYGCTVERNLVVLSKPLPQNRDQGMLFAAFIRDDKVAVETQRLEGAAFRDNVLQGTGSALMRNTFPTRVPGDVVFRGNAYGEDGLFIEEARRRGLAEWRKANPEDGRRVAAKVELPDLKRLAPRDLPGFFKRIR